jgi:hypothetical protein
LETVPDAKFRAYIEAKKSDYEEGHTIDGQPLVANSFMLLSKNNYKGMKQNKTYNVPSPEDENIVALQAEVNKLQKAVKSGPKHPKEGKVRPSNETPKQKKDRPDKPA